MKKRCISILGSTGSVGRNTLRVARHLGNIEVFALAAGRNVQLLAEQIGEFRPRIAVCIDEECAELLTSALDGLGVGKPGRPEIHIGGDGLVMAAVCEPVDTVVSATVGAVGFRPTLRALEKGKRVALANKETLVMAGELMTRVAAESGAEILPVDSEHNALHQCLRGEDPGDVKRLVLTASGGPFRTSSLEAIENASPEEALNHPTWDMGDKITIDSATLMNKGLEVIEAHWLFGVEPERIDVIVHPQSVVHSMVELIDGSVIAQLGVTDMRHPIQYALTYPDRVAASLPPLDLASVSRLTFERPDSDRFPNLAIAYSAIQKGGTAPAVLNASNEVAVEAFLNRRIRLSEIAVVNRQIVDSHSPAPAASIEDVIEADLWARRQAETAIRRLSVAAVEVKGI